MNERQKDLQKVKDKIKKRASNNSKNKKYPVVKQENTKINTTTDKPKNEVRATKSTTSKTKSISKTKSAKVSKEEAK